MRRSGWILAAVAAGTAGCTSKEAITSHGPLPRCSAAASTVALAAGAYAAYDITADSGCAVFAANASTTDSAVYLVVVQSAGGPPGDAAAYQVGARLSAPPPVPELAVPAAPRRGSSVQRAFDAHQRQRARRAAPEAARAALRADLFPGGAAKVITPPDSGSLRTFSVCSNLTCTTYKPATGRALFVGAHIALYVDTLAPSPGLSAANIDSLAMVFDQTVYPLDTAAFGRESDLDSNGVVIVLLTNLVNQLVTTAQCDSGYVTGFFDAADLNPATSAQHNHGEVFYGLVPDPGGALSCPHLVEEVTGELPPTFAHEFEHMINYVQHVLVRGGSPEDDWLDEALAKYAEELTADQFLAAGDTAAWGIDIADEFYNVYLYFAAPERHFLLTTSDQSLADVGAGWLFVRFLVDHAGPAITPKLVQTALTGTGNVAAQAGLPFATLVERWALADWVSDLPGFTAPAELHYTSYPLRQVFADLNAAYQNYFPPYYPLVPTVASPGTLDLSGSLGAGSGIYLLVAQAPGAGADTLHVNAGAAALPAALVPQFAVVRIR